MFFCVPNNIELCCQVHRICRRQWMQVFLLDPPNYQMVGWSHWIVPAGCEVSSSYIESRVFQEVTVLEYIHISLGNLSGEYLTQPLNVSDAILTERCPKSRQFDTLSHEHLEYLFRPVLASINFNSLFVS